MTLTNLLRSSPIPNDWKFTPEAMTHIIAKKNPGVCVSDVNLWQESNGTCSRAWLELRYSSGQGPSIVFAKTKGDWLRRMFQLMTDNAYLEGMLFSSGVELPLEHPLVYHAIVDRPRLNDLVIMEDLNQRNATMNDARQALSMENVASGLRELAKLHSRFWRLDSASHPELNWLQPWKASRTFQFLLNLGCKQGSARLKEHLPDDIMKLGPKGMIENWVRYLYTVNQGPMTFLHGDAHVGNTYLLPDGTLGFLDWGVVRKGHWSFDVGYFIISCLNEKDCRLHAADLLKEYLNALTIPDQDRPGFDEAWLRYRCSPAYGLPIWVTTGAEDGYQAPEICANLSRRFATAFLELDTIGAIDTLSAKKN